MATIFGALLIAGALIVGIWYFATQNNDSTGEPTGVTVEVDPGGDPGGE